MTILLSRHMARWALLPVLAACTPEQPARSASDQAAEGPGERCLVDARAERVPAPDAPSKIEVSHILVRHRELTDPRGATRSPEEACLRALAALKMLEGGGDWSAAVTKYSESKSDDLGRVNLDELSPAFGAAAFALEAEQLSYVVESDRGFHIILRTE